MTRSAYMQRRAGASLDAPSHWLEQEADRLADKALAAPHTPASPVGRAHPRTEPMQGAVPDAVRRTLTSPGRALDEGLRRDMTQRFGHDFARVRVHTDSRAGQSAVDLQAQAYTVGHA
ncbi:MAG: DUF4157 domain-containing protein, partial [Comamonadaceae bacterium]